MISSTHVLEALFTTDPFPMTEPVLRTQLSEALGSRPIGNGELTEALQRLAARRFVVSCRNDDSDPLWGLTPEGRTEANHRYR